MENNEDDVVRDTFTPDQNRSVSEAVLEAIEQYKGDDGEMTDFVLYDDIDPDALDNLFRNDAQPRTTVAFDTDDVRVGLWGDSGVEIRVRGRPE